jgi:hypothetical protein
MRLTLLPVLFCLLLGCDPYRMAWVTTASIREVAFQTEAAIAQKLREKVKSCSQTHAAVIKLHNDCVRACDTSAKPGSKEHDDCKTACHKTHEAALAPYKACVKPNYDANEAWIKYARPSVNSALTITVTSIQLAESVKDKKLPWLQYLMPALCTLAEVLQQWKDVLPDNVKNMILLATRTVSAITCKK